MEQPGSSMPAPSAASAILSITFPYSIVVPHGENPEDTDRVIFGLCEDAARQNRCQVAYSRIETTPYRLPYDSAAQQKIMVQHIYVITVVGGLREITTVRGVVLRSNLSQVRIGHVFGCLHFSRFCELISTLITVSDYCLCASF